MCGFFEEPGRVMGNKDEPVRSSGYNILLWGCPFVGNDDSPSTRLNMKTKLNCHPPLV